MSDLSRRKLLVGLGALIAAPAVARCASLMPVRGIVMMDARGMAAAMGQLLYGDTFTIDMMMAAREVMKACGIPPYYLKEEAVYFLRVAPSKRLVA